MFYTSDPTSQFPVQPSSSLPIQYPTAVYYPSVGQDLNAWRYGPQQKHMRYPVYNTHRHYYRPSTEHPDYASVSLAIKKKAEWERSERQQKAQNTVVPVPHPDVRKSGCTSCDEGTFPNIVRIGYHANPMFHPFFEQFRPDIDRFPEVSRRFNNIANLRYP